MNLDDFSVVVDEENNQRAISPETSLAEQNAFIDNLRNVQSAQNAEIRQQTHDLGTDVPSQLGGLTGGEGYFAARYQTPYTNAAVADLRTAAQAQALSEAFDLELTRANAAYNAAAKAARERAARRRSSGGGRTATPSTPTTTGEVEYETTSGKTIGKSEEVYETIDKDAVKKNESVDARNQILNNALKELEDELKIAEQIKKERKKK